MHASNQRRKQVLENCPISLEIDRLIKLGILMPGFSSSKAIYWTNSAGRKIFSVSMASHLMHPALSWVELRFSVSDGAGKHRDVEQTISVTETYPGFGPVRYWFVDDEGRRAGTLYLPEGSDRFGSRHEHRLAYATQRLTRAQRAARRHAKIMQRLNANPSSRVVPCKPPRMQWRTYQRLASGLRRLADEMQYHGRVKL